MAPAPRTDIRPNDARENLREEPARLVRRRGMSTDKYYVPEHLKKEGFSYEWHRFATAGMQDVEHQVMLAENHWQPVLAEEMPGMMPAGYKGAIERGGQRLMVRPSYLTEEAQQENLDAARARVRTQERRLGMAGRDELPRTPPKVSKGYEPLTAAEKASVRTIPE